MNTKLLAALLLLTTTACTHAGQNNYNWQDVGQASTVQFGTVISQKPVDITGRNTGLGALAAGAAGAGAGSYIGKGSGQAWGAGAGMLVGALIGAAIEQEASNHKGIEYIVTKEDGTTVSIVQNQNTDDKPIKNGARVMIQTSGTYQRILPAEGMPTTIKRPKRIKVKD